MHGARGTNACSCVVVPGPVIPFVRAMDPLDVPHAAGRTWVLERRARTAVGGSKSTRGRWPVLSTLRLTGTAVKAWT